MAKTSKYDPDPKTDKWFEWKGLKKPQRHDHGITDTQENPLSEQLAENLRGHKCDWKQAGNEIYCESDPSFRHGKMIRPDQRLEVDKDGKPRLVALKPIYRDTKPAERLQK